MWTNFPAFTDFHFTAAVLREHKGMNSVLAPWFPEALSSFACSAKELLGIRTLTQAELSAERLLLRGSEDRLAPIQLQ